jgi:hypothetical protein
MGRKLVSVDSVPNREAQPAERPICEHHWVSRHQPDLPIYWVDQCSICGDFNAARMREEIDKARVAALEAEPETPTQFGVALYGRVEDVRRFPTVDVAQRYVIPEQGDILVQRKCSPWRPVVSVEESTATKTDPNLYADRPVDGQENQWTLEDGTQP